METFDVKTLRKLFRMSPRANRLHDEIRASIRAERVANPPGRGNLRDLKAQADKDALHRTYETIAGEPAHAEDARLYQQIFRKEHGDVAVRA